MSRLPPPIPADFTTFAATRGADELRGNYRAGGIAIRRWINEQTPAWREERTRYLDEIVRAARSAGHAAKFDALRAAKPPKPAKVSRPRTTKRNPLGYLGNDAQLGDGIAIRAAEHLKRATAYRPVVSGKIYGKAMADLYIVGNLKMTVPDMIAMAERHGFQRDWASA